MNTYLIKYENPATHAKISVHRRAEKATDAIVRLCIQYGWSYTLDMFDADTWGRQWAKMWLNNSTPAIAIDIKEMN